MSKELTYTKHPWRSWLRWAGLYTVLACLCVVALIVVTGRYRTYTIPQGALTLSIPYAKYLVGETITFSLTNNYNATVYLSNDCPSEPLAVYRRDKNQWVRIHDMSKEKCSSKERQISLAPGETRKGSFAQWPKLFATPGNYRIAALVEYFTAVPYQDFEVVKKPVVAAQQPSVPQPSPSTVQPAPSKQQTAPETSQTPAATRKTITVSGGSISVSYTSSYITVLSITPSSGCRYEGGRSGREVEVQFKCSGNETEIELRVEGGQLQQKIENDD